MKKILLIGLCLTIYFSSRAQTNYTISYSSNVGNPGGLNTVTDEDTTGWNRIISGAAASNQWSAIVTLPFPFNYFGNPVTNFKASANGLITFNTATSVLPNDNSALPASSLPDSTIACFWDAFTSAPPTGNNDLVVWQVMGTAPNRQLWIKWVSFETGAPSVADASFMCMLEETTDKIYLVEGSFTIGLVTPAATTTAGIQLNSSTALMYSHPNRNRVVNASVSTDNNVLTFAPYVKSNMVFTTVEANQPLQNNIPKGSVNEAILRIDIDMTGELSPLSISQIAFNTSGTTTNSNITNAKVFYGGNDSNYTPAAQFGTTVTSPSGAFAVNGTQQLKAGKNYFWLAYSIASGAASSNVADASLESVTIASVLHVPSITAPTGSRTIQTGLSGTVDVGTGNTFVYLSDVFKEINTNGLSGNTILSITSDILDDTAMASLNYHSANGYSITIVPSADVVRNITARFPGSYIELSNIQYLTIDGKGPVSGTGKYLRFLNKDALGSTIRFTNGSGYDTIRNCIIEGAINSLTQGMIHLGTSAQVSTGIRNIGIVNNDIRDRSDSTSIPAILIYSAGTTALPNGNITITGNNLFNYRRSGVYVNSGDVNDGNYTISSNHFYYNASTTPSNGDVVSIMFIPGANSENNVIQGNYIGGQAPFCGGSAWLTANGVNWIGMNINAGFSIGTSIQANTIQNINMTSSAAVDFVAIRLESGKMNVGTISGNMIGHPTTPNSILNNMHLTLGIYSLTGAGEFNIGNNTIANLTGTGTGTLASASSIRGISIQRGGAIPNIYNNTIYNLTSAGTQTTAVTSVIIGIGLNSTSELGPIIVRNNKMYNFTATNTTGNIVPSGIIVDNATSNGIIEGNIIYNINNLSSGSTASIHGIYIQSNPKNWIVKNNMISLTNGTNTNAVTIRGISDNGSGNVISYINNTVYIGGTASSGNSYAFERRVTSAITLRNNLLYNARTGGTGLHAAIANIAAATNWDGNTSGYNLLISSNSGSIGAWGATPVSQSFAQWQTTTGGDQTSWSDTVAKIPAASLFKDLANGNLAIDTTSALSWYANGKGIAITGNNTDIHNQPRSVTIATGAVDIGADEFALLNSLTPGAPQPPLATVTGNIALADSSTFTVAGRVVGRILWNSGVLPTTIDLRYYTGEFAPVSSQTGNRFNSYYQFLTVIGAGTLNADVKLYYDSALFGTVPSAAQLRMVSGSSTPLSWNTLYPSTTVNTTERSFTATGVGSLDLFTGTNISIPLPVELIQFTGTVSREDAALVWKSASEINTLTYIIERSTDGKTFKAEGSVKAFGKGSSYNFTDKGIFATTAFAYYRLKMVDRDGSATYSKTILLQAQNRSTINAVVYPNPAQGMSGITFTTTAETDASFTLTDISGNVVLVQTFRTQNGTNTMPIDMTPLSQGIYFVTLNVEGNIFRTKLLK